MPGLAGMVSVLVSAMILGPGSFVAAGAKETLDPNIFSSAAVACDEVYEGTPPPLEIKDRSTYIQPWSGYCPECTLPAAKNLPCMTANIKYTDYRGVERQGNKWMERACALALQSAKCGLDPFGTVLVQIDDETGKVIRYWQAVNLVNQINDVTAHAEINAMRGASRDLGVARFDVIAKAKAKLPQTGKTSHLEIYTSHESCPMCYAAMRMAHMPVLHFACTKYDGQVQGLGYAHGTLTEELGAPLAERVKYGGMHVYQCTVGNSLDALNLHKRSAH